MGNPVRLRPHLRRTERGSRWVSPAGRPRPLPPHLQAPDGSLWRRAAWASARMPLRVNLLRGGHEAWSRVVRIRRNNGTKSPPHTTFRATVHCRRLNSRAAPAPSPTGVWGLLPIRQCLSSLLIGVPGTPREHACPRAALEISAGPSDPEPALTVLAPLRQAADDGAAVAGFA